jgi:hypothetical protein
MMMLEIGDKVKIINKEKITVDIRTKNPGFTEDMEKMCGKAFTISEIQNHIDRSKYYILDGCHYCWIDEYFEKTNQMDIEIE